MNISKDLENDIREYCKINGIKPIPYVNDLLKKAFMKDKYGDKPPFLSTPKKNEAIAVPEIKKEDIVVEETKITPVIETTVIQTEKDVEPQKIKRTRKRTLS